MNENRRRRSQSFSFTSETKTAAQQKAMAFAKTINDEVKDESPPARTRSQRKSLKCDEGLTLEEMLILARDRENQLSYTRSPSAMREVSSRLQPLRAELRQVIAAIDKPCISTSSIEACKLQLQLVASRMDDILTTSEPRDDIIRP